MRYNIVTNDINRRHEWEGKKKKGTLLAFDQIYI